MISHPLSGRQVDDSIGTNVHVILEEYQPDVYNGRDLQNASTHVDGFAGAQMSKSLSLDGEESHKVNGTDTARSLKAKAISLQHSRRRLFVFSANDKSALVTQMHDICMLQHC